MVIATLLAIPGFNPVAFHFDGMVEAQAHVKQERIKATVQTFAQQGTINSTQIIDVIRGKEAKIQSEPNNIQNFLEIKYYKVTPSGSMTSTYRPVSGQFTQSHGDETSLAQVVKNANSTIDDFVVSLLIPQGMSVMRDQLKSNTKGWTYSPKSGRVILALKTKDALTEITLDQKSLRPSKMKFVNQGAALIWTFQYEPMKPIKWPKSEPRAFLVSQFDPMLGKANTKTASAKTGLEHLFERYDAPESIGYTVTVGKETTEVYYSQSSAYQSDSFAEWEYDGYTLTLLNKANGKVYAGKASREDVIAAVASTGSRIETGLRSLIIGRNPYRLMLNSFSDVSHKGAAKASEPAELLFADSPFADLQLTIAKKDGFVLKIESTPKTQRGQKLPTSISVYKRLTGAKTKVSAPASAQKGNLSELIH
ncbi:MAG: hypothetical protein ACKVQS_10980 [Fimbriimonadaceae bacterium]